jgi:hypothetical protein
LTSPPFHLNWRIWCARRWKNNLTKNPEMFLQSFLGFNFLANLEHLSCNQRMDAIGTLKLLSGQMELEHAEEARPSAGRVVPKGRIETTSNKPACERAFKIFEKFLPPNHPNIKIVKGNLEGL